MLFSRKENVFMCLSATKFVLRKINSGVWFIQTFLQKMLYIPNFPYTSSTVNLHIMNQFHTHSQKKQNPVKKFIKSGQIEIARRRRRWNRAVKARSEARLVRSFDKRRDRRSRSMSGAIASEVSSSSLSLRSGLSLLSLSLSLFPEMIWSENESVKSFPGQRSKCWSTGNDFPKNFIFRCCQTRGFGGKWFPEIIFPPKKCTLNESHKE